MSYQLNLSFSSIPSIVGLYKDDFQYPTKAHPSDAAYDLYAWPDLETLTNYSVKNLDLALKENICWVNGKKQKIANRNELLKLNALYIEPHSTLLIGTGVSIEMSIYNSSMIGNEVLPAGLVLPRSGLASKCNLSVANSPGLIDAGYRGEIKVALENRSKYTHIISTGMRIAQLLLIQCFAPAAFSIKDNLSTTDRGDNGFGSTGV